MWTGETVSPELKTLRVEALAKHIVRNQALVGRAPALRVQRSDVVSVVGATRSNDVAGQAHVG
jgi:hypothetical protein